MSQTEMIEILKKMCLCSDDGVINRGDEATACNAFNIRFFDVAYHYPIEDKYNDGSLLIGTSKPGLHCVRFARQDEDTKIVIMDPAFGDFRYMDKHELENSCPDFHHLELELKK